MKLHCLVGPRKRMYLKMLGNLETDVSPLLRIRWNSTILIYERIWRAFAITALKEIASC